MNQNVVLFCGWKRSFSVLTVSLALCFPNILFGAQSVTLAWDPSQDSTVVGYRVHYGEASGVYTQVLDAGNATRATIPALLEGHTYYFAVSAYDSAALESDFSNEIQFTVPVSTGNNPPVANNSTVQGPEDQPLPLILSVSDPDGNPLAYTIVTSPAHGSLTGLAPNLTYQPQTNYNGQDSFTFRVNDGTTNSATAKVSITIAAVNDAPMAISQSVTVTAGAPVNILLKGTDVDGDLLSYTVVAPPLHGLLIGQPPNLTYTPLTNYSGNDSFTFKVNDGKVYSSVASVSISVTAGNTAPVAFGKSVVTPEDTTVGIVLNGSDAKANPLSYVVVSGPVHGVLNGQPPNLTYTPQPNYNGTDSFTFKVNDGAMDSATAMVSITVTPINDAPVARSQSVVTVANIAVNITLSGSDVDNDPLTYAITAQPARGALTGQAPNLTYTPQASYSGSDSFTFKVNDGKVSSASATISISVTKSNSRPNGRRKKLNTVQNASLVVVLEADDADGDTLSYEVVASPTNGTLSGETPNLIYTPNAGFVGDDSLAFVASDGMTNSLATAVLISVVPPDSVPQITGVSFNSAGLQLTWNAVVGKTYRVRYKDSLEATTWTTAAEELTASSDRMDWVDSGALSAAQRFYIVELVDP